MSDNKIRHIDRRWTLVLAGALILASVGVSGCGSSNSEELDAANAKVADLEAQLTEAHTEVSDLETQLADATAAEDAASSDVVVVGGGPMTERQQAMVDLVAGPLADAWYAADGDAVAAFYTPDAVFYDMEGDGTETLGISDGTLQGFVERWPGLTTSPQLYVHDDWIVSAVELGGIEVGAVDHFTPEGDLLIESTILYNSELGPRH